MQLTIFGIISADDDLSASPRSVRTSGWTLWQIEHTRVQVGGYYDTELLREGLYKRDNRKLRLHGETR